MRGVFASEAAAIDMAVAGAVLQRNAPLPSGFARRDLGIGLRRSVTFAWYGEGAVAGQPVGPVLVAGLQRAFAQQAAKAAAVDEQVGLDRLAILHRHGFDEAGLGVQLD